MRTSQRSQSWARRGGAFRLAPLIAVAALLLHAPAVADPAERVEEARDSVSRAESQLGSVRTDAQSAAQRLEEIEAEFGLAVDQYNQAQVDLEEIREKVAEAQEELSVLAARIVENEEKAGDFIRKLYQQGSGYELEALLGASDLSEIQVRAVYLQSTAEVQYGIVAELNADRLAHAQTLADLREMRHEAEDLQQELAQRREQIERMLAAQEDEVAELRAIVAAAQDELGTAQVELSAAQREQARIEEERRRAEEEARQRAEEEQAREAAAREAAEEAAAEQAAAEQVASQDSGQTSSQPSPSPQPSQPPPQESSPPPPSSGDRGQQAVDAALSQLGKPYQWGATGPDSYDCSGLTLWSWRQAGVSIPRTSQQQYNGTTRVSRAQLRPGDLVFFDRTGTGTSIHHVAMYIGGGDVVEAPFTGENVRINRTALNRSDLVGYGRVRH